MEVTSYGAQCSCQKKAENSPSWTSIGKVLVGGANLLTNDEQIFSYAAHGVPNDATQVLFYVVGSSGYNPGNDQDIHFQLFTVNAETGEKYTKYFYLRAYPQNAWSFNSENMFFPATGDNAIHVVRTSTGKASAQLPNAGLFLYLIGYKL